MSYYCTCCGCGDCENCGLGSSSHGRCSPASNQDVKLFKATISLTYNLTIRNKFRPTSDEFGVPQSDPPTGWDGSCASGNISDGGYFTFNAGDYAQSSSSDPAPVCGYRNALLSYFSINNSTYDYTANLPPLNIKGSFTFTHFYKLKNDNVYVPCNASGEETNIKYIIPHGGTIGNLDSYPNTGTNGACYRVANPILSPSQVSTDFYDAPFGIGPSSLWLLCFADNNNASAYIGAIQNEGSDNDAPGGKRSWWSDPLPAWPSTPEQVFDSCDDTKLSTVEVSSYPHTFNDTTTVYGTLSPEHVGDIEVSVDVGTGRDSSNYGYSPCGPANDTYWGGASGAMPMFKKTTKIGYYLAPVFTMPKLQCVDVDGSSGDQIKVIDFEWIDMLGIRTAEKSYAERLGNPCDSDEIGRYMCTHFICDDDYEPHYCTDWSQNVSQNYSSCVLNFKGDCSSFGVTGNTLKSWSTDEYFNASATDPDRLCGCFTFCTYQSEPPGYSTSSMSGASTLLYTFDKCGKFSEGGDGSSTPCDYSDDGSDWPESNTSCKGLDPTASQPSTVSARISISPPPTIGPPP